MIDLIFVERMCFFGIGALAGYFLGRSIGAAAGIKAERLRVDRAFDVAFCTITSGALKKVYRRITGEYSSDHELRANLVREIEAREKEREFQRRFG
jgi:2,3-bisphosphoglycerate-independent phosphoglycerate mutase